MSTTAADGPGREPPRRIVSLVPSLTELLVWLGAGESLVGRTRFCTEPVGVVESVPAVGGTKDPRIDRIVALAPDLVVANREENRREDVDALRAAGLEVLVTDPADVPGALDLVSRFGRLLGAEERAAALTTDTAAALAAVPSGETPVCTILWKRPWMALGSGTYGHDLLARCGGRNVFGGVARYPVVTFEDVAAAQPALILLPDEPFRFRPADARGWSSVAPARVIEGRLLWWYGPRMPAAIRTLSALLSVPPG